MKMTISLCVITGTWKNPAGVAVVDTAITFDRIGRVTGDGLTIVPSRVVTSTDATGLLAVSLYPGRYSVSFTFETIEYCYRVTVPSVATITHAELLSQVGAITPAVVATVNALANAAQVSADQAAQFGNPNFLTLALASAYANFTPGQTFIVWAGFNGEPETFKYVSDSTLTANGALVLASAMATGRLISTRTTYANFAEMDADARPIASGVTLSIPGVAEYNRVTTGEHLTLASGFKVKARIGADGFGPGIFGIIGDLSVDETAKMQAMVDAWDAMDDKGVIYMGNARVLIAGSILLSNRLVMRDGDGDIAAVQNKPIMKFIGGTFVKRNAGFIFDKKRVADDSVLDGYDAADFTFTGTAFEGDASVGGMYAFNADNIIQVGLIGTTGTQMGLAKSAATVDMSGDDWSGYLQSYSQSESCTWVGQAGYLVDVGILYALELHGKNQQGDAVLKTRSNATDPACNGLSVMGTIQGCSGAAGPAISVGACYASTIGPKLYLEANAGGDIDASLGGTVSHKGLSFIGIGAQPTTAQIANADYYAIRVGRTASGALISGCYSTSNLAHIPANNEGDISIVGSGVAAGKKIVNADARRYLLVSGGVVESVSTASARIGLFAGFSEIFWGGLTETVDSVEVPVTLSWGEQSPAASPGSFPRKKFATGSRVFKPTITTVTIKNSYNQDEAVWLQGWTCIGGHDTSDTDAADMWVPDYGTKAYVAP